MGPVAAAVLLRPTGARRGPRPARSGGQPPQRRRRGGAPAHRGRGVRRGGERPGVARVPGSHCSQRGDVRPSPAPSTCTSPTACTGASTWSVVRAGRQVRCCCGPVGWSRVRRWPGPTAGRARGARPGPGARPADRRARRRRHLRRCRRLRPGSDLRGSTGAAEIVRRWQSGRRVGVSGAGAATPWRFWLVGDPTVSRTGRAAARTRAGHQASLAADTGGCLRADATSSTTCTWRGLIAQSTDLGALRGPPRARPGHPATAASTRPHPACTSATWSRLLTAAAVPARRAPAARPWSAARPA